MSRSSSQPALGLGGDAAFQQAESAADGPLLLRLWQAFSRLQHASGDRVAIAQELSDVCRQICEMHRIEVEIVGSLPRGPTILVANHLGYIDPLVLCSLVPCSPIAKSEIMSWPIVGEPLQRMNVSFVRRGSAHSGARVLKQCLRSLHSGVSVLNFPEGTTSRGGLLPFQLGAFWLARKSGLPIVPVGVEFETADMCWVDAEAFLPHYARLLWSKLQGKRRQVRVCVGAPIQPAQFRSEIDTSWAARSAIAQLRRPYSAPRAPRP